MASVSKVTLIDETALAATTTGSKQTLEQRSDKFIGLLKMANESGTVTLGGSIEHSPDGLNWTTLKAFTGLTADGIEEQQITTAVWPNVRGKVTIAGGGNGDIEVSLWYDKI